MTGLALKPRPRNEALDRFGLDFAPASLGQTLGATASDPTLSPTGLAARQLELVRAAGEDIDPVFGQGATAGGQTPVMEPEALNEEYGHLGLSFDQPTRRGVAELLAAEKRREIARQSVMARGPSGVMATAAQFGTALAVSVIDPINVASAFVPVVSQARYAGWVARFGATGARASRGVIEGTVGAALVEPLVAGMSRAQQLDYTMSDAMVNIALGGALGGGLHVVSGKVGDLMARATPETREATLRSSVAQMAEGRAVNVDPVIRTDPDIDHGAEFDRLFAEAAAPVSRGTPVAEAPAAREFDLGQPVGEGVRQRFEGYTALSDREKADLEAVVGELETTSGGERFFMESEVGGAPEVIGIRGTTPEWFRRANDEARRQQKAAAKARKRGEKGQRAPQILTRKKVRDVAEKLKVGQPLGRAEADVALEIMGAARDMRRQNIEDMLQFRANREASNATIRALVEEEIDAIARREAGIESDLVADIGAAEETDRIIAEALDDYNAQAATQAATEAEEITASLRDQGFIDEVAQAELDEIARIEAKAAQISGGAQAAAACMARP